MARAGLDVTLFARGPQLRAIEERGVRVLSPDGDFEVRPKATGELKSIGPVDVLFLAVKAHGGTSRAEAAGLDGAAHDWRGQGRRAQYFHAAGSGGGPAAGAGSGGGRGAGDRRTSGRGDAGHRGVSCVYEAEGERCSPAGPGGPARPGVRPSVPSMGRIYRDERISTELMTTTVAKRKA